MHKANSFAVVIVCLALVLTGCSNRATKCPIETLLLDENLFPKGTHAEPLESPLSEYPKESAARTYYYAPDSVFQEVINWSSDRAAKSEFELRSKSAFDVDKYMGPWETLDELSISSIAQNYHVACGIDGKIYQCRMVATYKGYFVFFRAEVSDQGITLSKVNELLQAIDERMAQCVDQK
jgi:hypothetical protein